jgi:crotonobetainyl-CoA:carnitine CoA-transferase CaiB-like acyl-CoA transferase
MSQTFAQTHDLLNHMWDALGGDAGLTDHVTFTGEGAMPSPFALTDLAGASTALVATAVSELLGEAGLPPRAIEVDRYLASGWWRLPLGPSHVLGQPLMTPMPPGMDFFTELPTADGRWLRLHGIFPSARARIVKALGVPDDIDAVAALVKAAPADEIEQRLVDGNAIVAASRTPEEWLQTPAGRAVDAEPLAAYTEHPASGSTWRPTPGRPLAGIKVLDMTRVIAGPVGTRWLASLGAEVLRLERPGSDEAISHTGHGAEMVLGKRWAFLDIKTPEGLAQFKSLLAEADVFVHGYRPGAIDGIISEAERRSLNPDLVEVAVRAYGWTGPWAMRRGFDTVVQFSTGLANATQRWALEDPEHRVPLSVNGMPVDASRPRHTTVEGLDFTTGHMIASAAIRGLTQRARTGAGSAWKFSLARTASMEIKLAREVADPGPAIQLPLDGPWEDRVYSGPFGPTKRLVWPVQIEGTPLFWERPAERVGSATPTFTF